MQVEMQVEMKVEMASSWVGSRKTPHLSVSLTFP